MLNFLTLWCFRFAYLLLSLSLPSAAFPLFLSTPVFFSSVCTVLSLLLTAVPFPHFQFLSSSIPIFCLSFVVLPLFYLSACVHVYVLFIWLYCDRWHKPRLYFCSSHSSLPLHPSSLCCLSLSHSPSPSSLPLFIYPSFLISLPLPPSIPQPHLY